MDDVGVLATGCVVGLAAVSLAWPAVIRAGVTVFVAGAISVPAVLGAGPAILGTGLAVFIGGAVSIAAGWLTAAGTATEAVYFGDAGLIPVRCAAPVVLFADTRRGLIILTTGGVVGFAALT